MGFSELLMEQKGGEMEEEKKVEAASGRAVTALIMGIVGIVVCAPLAIVAWVLGKLELNAIARGESSSKGRGLAMAGYILGIVGTILIILGIVLLAIFGTAVFDLLKEGIQGAPSIEPTII